jgi:predicted DCC family thiol-disulfide oxidoreductase YuxK
MNLLLPEGKILVRFDGMCILCSRTIRFILKKDKRKRFLFRTLQNSGGTETADSVIVFDGQTTYTHFDAILKIGKELGRIYRLVAVLKIIPRKWRHSLYLWIAENRYQWFGVRKSCYFPTTEEKERFI